MNIIRVRNVHRALPLALEILQHAGEKRNSRNGPVRVASGPVTTMYERPLERVLFWPERDANPFFHFFESLWMLGGRNDVASVARYAKQVAQYTDDGMIFHGVYGYRWRVGMPHVLKNFFGASFQDQLQIIGTRLRENPDDRRSVLQMWDARSDLNNPSRDVPCNMTATFQVDSSGHLNLVVFNRSNDIVWGCYGANAVQFATLLEYVAFRAGCKPGTYHQISVNWHGYDSTYVPLYERMVDGCPVGHGAAMQSAIQAPCPYETNEVKPYPLMSEGTDPDEWDRDLDRLLSSRGRAPVTGNYASDPFFQDVAIPMLRAHDAYKDGSGEDRYKRSLEALAKCQASDWHKACSEWINRRWKKFRKDADDGPTPE